jgi:hypothetical protein
MVPAVSEEENEEFDTPHLPQRYHQQVRAKKQRRLKKRLLTAAAVILVIAAICLILALTAGGFFSSGSLPHLPALTLPGLQTRPAVTGTVVVNISNTTSSFTRGPGLSAPRVPGMISLETAISTLRQDYPAADYTILTADLTDSSGRSLYVFQITPASPVLNTRSPVFIDAMSGTPYSPGEETAKISRSEAKQRALGIFPAQHPDRIIMVYSTMPEGEKQWQADLFLDSTKLGTVIMDADTGEIISFAKIIAGDSRPAEPAIGAEQAKAIADRYIINHNGGLLPLNMSLSRYDPFTTTTGPVAGQYTLTYERTFLDFPTDVNGFTVIVDAVTGVVTGYTQQWTTPDYAFSASAEPDVIKREATFAVLQKAKELYPSDVGGLRIISAEVRWKNQVPYGTIPRPGTIPLAWKVVFDDDIIRANTSAQPGVAWVDIQAGNFISFDYRH